MTAPITTVGIGELRGPVRSGITRDADVARQRSFARVLGIENRGPLAAADGPRGGVSTEAEARGVAEQLVATAFLQPMLKEIRAASDAAPPFQQTSGEKQFGALMDAQVALDVVRASRLPIVERLAQDLLGRSGQEVSG